MQPIYTTRASETFSESDKLPYVDHVEGKRSALSERTSDVEKISMPAEDLILYQYDLPLVPQPSKFKDDPLNWPSWLKWAVLVQVSFMAFLGPFNAAVVNPSLVLLGEAFHKPTNIVVYSTTIVIITGGLASFIWAPLTNVYGRRPITIISQLLAVLGNVGSARSTTFSALLGTRALNGIGMAGMMSVGTACVNDMFFLHERGEKTGVYTIFVTNGAHFAVLGGGFLGQKAGWAWDFWMPAITTSFSMTVAIFLFPETLFSRDPRFLNERKVERTYVTCSSISKETSSHNGDYSCRTSSPPSTCSSTLPYRCVSGTTHGPGHSSTSSPPSAWRSCTPTCTTSRVASLACARESRLSSGVSSESSLLVGFRTISCIV